MQVWRNWLTMPEIFVQKVDGIDKGLQRRVQQKQLHLALTRHVRLSSNSP
jgi:hypothetical protein